MLVASFCVILIIGPIAATPTEGDPTVRQGLRIIGGNVSSILNHPYQVSISISGVLKGSAVVINKKWIATTASILAGYRDLNKILVRTSSDHVDSDGRAYKVTHVVYHPRFSFSSMDYDVALIRVKRKMRFNKRLQSIKLATTKLPPEAVAVVSGWGSNSSSSYVFNHIKVVAVQVVNQTQCQAAYRDSRNISATMFCADSVPYGPCWEDNGDPLVFKGKLFGLLSWNKGCFDQQYPSIYTNIPAVRKWIKDTIRSKLLHHEN